MQISHSKYIFRKATVPYKSMFIKNNKSFIEEKNRRGNDRYSKSNQLGLSKDEQKEPIKLRAKPNLTISTNSNKEISPIREMILKMHRKNNSISYQGNKMMTLSKNGPNIKYSSPNERKDVSIKDLYIMELKIKFILMKICKEETVFAECIDLWRFYHSLVVSGNYYDSLFRSEYNKNEYLLSTYIETLCCFVCIDLSKNEDVFLSVCGTLRSIFKCIHFNFLFFCKFVLEKEINDDNYSYEELSKILATELNRNFQRRIIDEDLLINIVHRNTMNIREYYKIIIDKIYINKLSYSQVPDNNNFNGTLIDDTIHDTLMSYEKHNEFNLNSRINSFFVNTFNHIEKYTYGYYHKFFKHYLESGNNDKNSMNKSVSIYNQGNMSMNLYNTGDSKYCSTDNNITNKSFSKPKASQMQLSKSQAEFPLQNISFSFQEYLLPPINPTLKYTLVLDLDETLIHVVINRNEKIVLYRPGLFSFLEKMRSLYELVLYTLKPAEHSEPIVREIESKTIYFDHKIYRTYNTKPITFIKDLSLLGRNLNNVVIVDNIPQSFKPRENGIIIKPFYGNNDNALIELSYILEKIRFEDIKSIPESIRKNISLIKSKL